ncbi:MAG: CHASE4 domain-containing protein, partial [Patescibacteria group bacterium]
MGLRSKVFLYVGGILIVLFFVVYNVLSHLLINDFLALEKKETEQNLLRVNDALQAKIDELGVKISDWGQWDDTFVFVQDRNQEWIDSNTQNEGLEILSINILMVVDNEKQIVFKKYIDASGEDRDFPKGLEEYLVSHPEFLTHADSASEQHGVITVPEGQLVLAARAITSSDGGEAPAGTIIFAYFIGESLIE